MCGYCDFEVKYIFGIPAIVDVMEMKPFDRLEYFISSHVNKTNPSKQFVAPFKAANF
jgi:hypothetical protein